MLLEKTAATWWLCVKNSIMEQEATLTELKETYGSQIQNYPLYEELFDHRQEHHIPTDQSIYGKRAILARIRQNNTDEAQVDIIFCMLNLGTRTAEAGKDPLYQAIDGGIQIG